MSKSFHLSSSTFSLKTLEIREEKCQNLDISGMKGILDETKTLKRFRKYL